MPQPVIARLRPQRVSTLNLLMPVRLMYDWTEVDISHISEADFPIRCDRCDHELQGPGESGRCSECGLPFSRRHRLWQTYGPEAFADPPITPAEQEASRKDTAFLSGLLAGVIVTLCLPVVILMWIAVFGAIDLHFCLIAWIVVVAAAVWLAVVARTPRAESNATKHNVEDSQPDSVKDRISRPARPGSS
ncbi:MAG: hypothetical protein JSU86_20100 [Phycisphaerales bacterium]|nr:MAG: hypothetical protein JSU86_20100 [Phycisphaerales bacterium]